MQYDVFISHASEDKESVARPLAKALQQLDLRVWLDEVEITIGDSLRRTIDKGLATSTFGVVVLSPAFFEKEWLQRMRLFGGGRLLMRGVELPAKRQD